MFKPIENSLKGKKFSDKLQRYFMKPNDLKPPYSWEERHPCILDGIFYVPPRFDAHQNYNFPLWHGVFPKVQAISIEYCSGNGKWIAARAQNFPGENFVAVDIRFDRLRKIWSKKKNEQIENLFCVYGDGYTLSRHYIPSDSVSKIYINFPDPWPKLRHAKNRLMTHEFIRDQNRVLKSGGQLTFVTDDFTYLQQTLNAFKKEGSFQFSYPEPFYSEDLPFSYGSSYFEELWRAQGKKIYVLQVEKK